MAKRLKFFCSAGDDDYVIGTTSNDTATFLGIKALTDKDIKDKNNLFQKAAKPRAIKSTGKRSGYTLMIPYRNQGIATRQILVPLLGKKTAKTKSQAYGTLSFPKKTPLAVISNFLYDFRTKIEPNFKGDIAVKTAGGWIEVLKFSNTADLVQTKNSKNNGKNQNSADEAQTTDA